VLGWRLVAALGHEQPGAPEPLGLELLDHDAVEEGAQDVLHRQAPQARRSGGAPASPSAKMALVTARRSALGTAVFFLIGPGLEAGLGPFLLTRVIDPTRPWPAAVRVVGVASMAVGLGVLLAVFARFISEGAGTPSPAAPTRRLIVAGAYRYLRHPMYVATATVIVGEALAFAQPILLACAAVYLGALATLSRVREEPLLAARFGAEYEAYRRAVPGWWPRRRPWTPG
jgi:protein-S-isoprenylcysteine O-methyltransferase Ste14